MADTLVWALLLIDLTIFIVLYVVVRKLRELHLSMNSRLDELLKTTGKLARAEGFQAGQQDHLEALREAGSQLEPRRP